MTETTEFGISERAAARIKQLLDAQDMDARLRLSVRGGGCSGFSYEFSFDEELTADDKIFAAHDTEVVIDEMSLEFVGGSILDYVDELGGQYFKVQNPNATASCGCGPSFSI